MPIPTHNTRIFIRNEAGDTDIEVLGHLSISGLDGERTERDRTTQTDEDEVVKVGEVRRHGTATISMFHEEGDAGQAAMEAAYDNASLAKIIWLLPTGNAKVFDCYVKNWPWENGGGEDDYKATIKLRITGGVQKEAGYTILTGP